MISDNTAPSNRIIGWIYRQRTSVRFGFILQLVFRVLFALLSLVWTPLLLKSMGPKLNGLFLSFLPIAALGGLGDLGMGGAVNIQTSRLLGQKNDSELRSFLGAARALFLLMAIVTTVIILVLSPWIPEWLKFVPVQGSGSLSMLFVVGAFSAGLVIINSYIANLNYGCGNLALSVIPTFFLAQLGFFFHWLLARSHFPLWAQYFPYVAASAVGVLLGWFYIRMSHPWLAEFRPVFDRKRASLLLEKSFWVYFYTAGAGITATIDRLLINAGFGAERVPSYVFNYKLCELALFVVMSASLVSMPKIARWIASPDSSERERAINESERLNKFQTFLGCAAALVYLGANDTFIRHWLGSAVHVPLMWQVAFAALLAVTAAGYVGFDLAARCHENGIRAGGITILFSVLINLMLSYIAMKMGSILGIAVATVISHSFLVLVLGYYSAHKMKISWWHLSFKNWIIALVTVAVGFGLRRYLSFDSALDKTQALAFYGGSFALLAFCLKISPKDIRHETALLRQLFSKGSGKA